ncbi:hypothetical protein SAMN05216553_12164 [Lentzea fradiae]|uniref:Uncharacterized protein n=1 Tax=Lentzea fradiae TaxID=200378 RepID=A0A1G8C8K4_9PSEU|nr:hypothetical protein [Lentzea fradiae]SDH41744.1 hypothetical protein SAMN05216553_12164 [Lentzea fradiae]
MPIRTNRGRAAVYRRLWGWPLRSPRHLAAAIIMFVVVVVALGVLIPRLLDRGPAGQQVAAPPSTSAPGTQVGQLPASGASLPTKEPAPSNSAKAAPPAADAQLVAELWAENWIKPPPNNDVDKWLKQLDEYTTPEFLAQMATIDPRNVPKELTDRVKAVSSTTSSIDFEVPTDLGKVRITTVRAPDGKWRVNSYTKAD